MVGLHGSSDGTSSWVSGAKTRAAAFLRRFFVHQTPKAMSTRRPTTPPATLPMIGAMPSLCPPLVELAPIGADPLCVAATMVVVYGTSKDVPFTVVSVSRVATKEERDAVGGGPFVIVAESALEGDPVGLGSP